MFVSTLVNCHPRSRGDDPVLVGMCMWSDTRTCQQKVTRDNDLDSMQPQKCRLCTSSSFWRRVSGHQLSLLAHGMLPLILPTCVVATSATQTGKGEVSAEGKVERYQLEFINIVTAITCGDCSACRRLENEVSVLGVLMVQHV